MYGRRKFIKSLGGTAILAQCGCRSWSIKERPLSPNYFCTWRTQGALLKESRREGIAWFPGDQGNPSTRDNLNEEFLFGKNGLAGFYPGSREDLIFTIDDGWDVPYATDPQKRGSLSLFGAMVPDAVRFPSLRGTPDRQLRQLADMVEDAGWHGLGLWMSPVDEPEDAIKRKLEWCAKGNVSYLKVDWGTGAAPHFRKRMYELKQQIAGDIIMEHCRVQPPLNGIDERGNGNGRRLIGDSDRIIREDSRLTLPYCDVWRVYDWFLPLVVPQIIERTVCDLKMIGETGSRAIVNTEDALYIACALGCSFGIMRSKHTAAGNHTASDISRRLKEVDRAVAWARKAAPFNGGAVNWSDTTLSDSWYARKGEFWYQAVIEREITQHAPAIVSRNLPLPEVAADADMPYVLATRYPNGMIALAALPRVRSERLFTPMATVRIDAEIAPGSSIGVFGISRAVSLKARARLRVFVSDLAGGARQEISAACHFADGFLTLPGELLTKIGKSMDSDESLPAALVEFSV